MPNSRNALDGETNSDGRDIDGPTGGELFRTDPATFRTERRRSHIKSILLGLMTN